MSMFLMDCLYSKFVLLSGVAKLHRSQNPRLYQATLTTTTSWPICWGCCRTPQPDRHNKCSNKSAVSELSKLASSGLSKLAVSKLASSGLSNCYISSKSWQYQDSQTDVPGLLKLNASGISNWLYRGSQIAVSELLKLAAPGRALTLLYQL